MTNRLGRLFNAGMALAFEPQREAKPCAKERTRTVICRGSIRLGARYSRIVSAH